VEKTIFCEPGERERQTHDRGAKGQSGEQHDPAADGRKQCGDERRVQHGADEVAEVL
jgi:hypothetical protein